MWRFILQYRRRLTKSRSMKEKKGVQERGDRWLWLKGSARVLTSGCGSKVETGGWPVAVARKGRRVADRGCGSEGENGGWPRAVAWEGTPVAVVQRLEGDRWLWSKGSARAGLVWWLVVVEAGRFDPIIRGQRRCWARVSSKNEVQRETRWLLVFLKKGERCRR
jgi:hypothetical protein